MATVSLKDLKKSFGATDVIHGFFVPAFRLKEDCVPGRHNKAWFESTRDGEYNIFCAEYCGERHSAMLSSVKSIPAREFDEWMGVAPVIPEGRELLAVKGCIACHSLDGSKLIGPTFQGIWGRTETVVLPDGTKRDVVVDEDYVRKSVMDPAAELVDGYQNLMPPQGNLVNEEELEGIIEALKDL